MILCMYINEDQDNWDEILPFVNYSYNTGARSSTGNSPYELLLGRKPRLPIDLLLVPSPQELSSTPELVQKLAARLRKVQGVARAVNQTAQVKMKKRYDARARQVSFKQGDLVLRRIERYQAGTSCKLAPFWDGPHRVVYAPTDAPNVIIRLFDHLSGKHEKVHVIRFKKYTERPLNTSVL